MITIYTSGQKKVYPEILRKILIKEYEEAYLNGFSMDRNKFVVDSLRAGRDCINLQTMSAK